MLVIPEPRLTLERLFLPATGAPMAALSPSQSDPRHHPVPRVVFSPQTGISRVRNQDTASSEEGSSPARGGASASSSR